jgi:hypothetical protein
LESKFQLASAVFKGTNPAGIIGLLYVDDLPFIVEFTVSAVPPHPVTGGFDIGTSVLVDIDRAVDIPSLPTLSFTFTLH